MRIIKSILGGVAEYSMRSWKIAARAPGPVREEGEIYELFYSGVIV